MVGEPPPAAGLRVIPLSFDNANSPVVDGPHAPDRSVGGARYVDNHLITHRQQRLNRLHERIPQLISVADESEAADFHAHKHRLARASQTIQSWLLDLGLPIRVHNCNRVPNGLS